MIGLGFVLVISLVDITEQLFAEPKAGFESGTFVPNTTKSCDDFPKHGGLCYYSLSES